MSWGGSVAAMISSLKNNRLLLQSVKERRKYAMQHHAEPKKKAKTKVRRFSPQVIARLKRENRAAFKRYLIKIWLLRILLFSVAIIGFYYLFQFLDVI